MIIELKSPGLHSAGGSALFLVPATTSMLPEREFGCKGRVKGNIRGIENDVVQIQEPGYLNVEWLIQTRLFALAKAVDCGEHLLQQYHQEQRSKRKVHSRRA